MGVGSLFRLSLSFQSSMEQQKKVSDRCSLHGVTDTGYQGNMAEILVHCLPGSGQEG